MHLHATPSLAAEVPGFSQEQLARLARSVEARRQQLEADITAYIARKQGELQQYESELVEQQHSQSPSLASPDEHKKQKKHGRVHKREQELYGLVTPVFLPLLDARDSPSPEKRQPKPPTQGLPASSASSASSTHTTSASDAQASEARRQQPTATHPPRDMPGETQVLERPAADPGKKPRRPSTKKKSALRHSSTPRNRKRVSLVIDDQVVLPSDLIQDPPLASPGSDTTSATASTASLDDMIDPRLTRDGPVYTEHRDAPAHTDRRDAPAHSDRRDAPVHIEHRDAMHHSLPLAATTPRTSPPKAAAPPEPALSPPTPPAYAPPSYATRSFLDPPPERMHIEDIPAAASPDAIYPAAADQPVSPAAAAENFQTYVGGISGSGVDDVNQVGSVGYPSSLGASYLESYMQGRPLSVRMAAAQREGDHEEMQRLRGLELRRKEKEDKEQKEKGKERVEEDEWDVDPARKEVDDDDFMGSMDDF